MLLNNGMGFDVVSTGAPLLPWESVTVNVNAKGKFNHISLAAMLLPTNDGFIAINGMRLPANTATHVIPGYDGSEINDELCFDFTRFPRKFFITRNTPSSPNKYRHGKVKHCRNPVPRSVLPPCRVTDRCGANSRERMLTYAVSSDDDHGKHNQNCPRTVSMRLSPTDLENQFPAAVLDLGRGLLAEKAVHSLQHREGGEVITALVASRDQKPFRVYARVQDHSRIHCECSCGQSSCEHAAAVLLAITASADETRADEAPQTRISDPMVIEAPATGQRLLYVLKPEPGINRGLIVDTVVARILNLGGYTEGNYFAPQRADKNNPARFLLPEDFEILAALNRLRDDAVSEKPLLKGPGSGRILEWLLRTGRCHAADTRSTPVKLGEARPLELDWRTEPTGVQQLQWCATPAATHIFLLDEPWYFDPDTLVSGKIRSDFPMRLLFQLLEHSSLAPEKATELLAWTASEFPSHRLPRLKSYDTRTVTAAPIACLRLFSRVLANEVRRHFAELSFTYGDIEVNAHTPERWFDGSGLVHVRRETEFERHCTRRLSQAGFSAVSGPETSAKDLYSMNNPEAWVDFQYDVLPGLREEEWRIIIDPDFQMRAAQGQSWYCETRRGENKDWFDFTIGVVIDGERVNLLPVLLNAIKHIPPDAARDLDSKNHVLQLQDGRWLRIPMERLRAILDTLVSLYASKSAKALPLSLRLPIYHLANIGELAASDSGLVTDWTGDGGLRSLTETLRLGGHTRVMDAPPALRAELRRYQQQGLGWLQFLREQNLGGILADDMGLGKTVQTLAHLLLEKQQGRLNLPSLIVAPTSLVFNWRNELRRFAPSLTCLCLHGASRQAHFNSIAGHDVVITTYALLLRDQSVLAAFRFHYLILDEAHYIKNPKTKAAQCVRAIDARHKLCLTGTPLENHLGELWSLFDFILPGFLGSARQFQDVFRTPIEKHRDTSRAESLARRLRPFMLRRTKDEVASELPEKTEIVRRIALSPAQQDLYESVRVSVHHLVRGAIQQRGLARSRITVLDALLKLRQVCCDPRLLQLEKSFTPADSAKLEYLTDTLPELVEEGRRILLFSQFTGMLALIEEEMKSRQVDYVKLTGQTTDRATPIERFQSGKVPLFLISLKAGGVGLNLTAADTVIHYDPWWNPAVERQATDRAHRIGQTQRVFVYKLICEGTVEEKILALQQHKQSLAESLFQARETADALWREQDIEALLGPVEA